MSKRLIYIIFATSRHNIYKFVCAFEQESQAKIYCEMKNKDAWIDKVNYGIKEVEVLDGCPELVEYVLKKSTVK